ncbi:MAG: HAMP domain-containing histidine kinase [Bacilli bacterium]|nr:HAMP domain-containing histidine kinase [Bacilli bacterium]
MKKHKSLIFKIFIYLIIFSLLILFFLWILQILLLNNYYEYYKTNELTTTLSLLKNNYNKDNFNSILEEVAYNTDFCVEIMNEENPIYSNIQNNKGCIDTNNNVKVLTEKQSFIQSGNSNFKLKIINPRFNNMTLLYGTKLDDNNYLFLNTSLEPIDTTINVLKNQFIIVSLIVIILATIIAYFISRSLSKPITKLTKSAKELSDGNYNVNFNVQSDILEIQELGESLDFAKSEIKKTDEIRRDLLSNVSHDLKTPLTMIKAYAEMERDLEISKEKHKNNMNIIIEEVDRLTILVNDILNLSKLESNMDTLNIEKFDLTSLINTILNRFKIFAYTKNYEFIFDYNKPLIVKADKQKLEQVIYNLVGNAINYTGDDHKVFVNLIDSKKGIRIEIKDTGKGIKKEDIDKVWDKYYKSEKKYKRNTIGTGIGLSIVKNIFILHKYQYGIDSTPNKGTTFWFIIPKNKKEQKN